MFYIEQITTLKLKRFVFNRVSKIQQTTTNLPWNHVRFSDTPADALSRDQQFQTFNKNHLWFKSPHWLKYKRHSRPRAKIESTIDPTEFKTHIFIDKSI